MSENEIKALETEALAIPEQAKAIVINDNASYAMAGNMLVQIKGLRKKIVDTFRPMKDAAVKAHKAILEQERQADAPLVDAERLLKPGMAAYNDEQERIRKAEEMRLQEIARKDAEARQIAEAVALEAQGEPEAAAQVLEEKIEAPPVIIPKTTPKVQGISYRDNWKFRITDASKIPPAYLVPDEIKIGKVVRALKSACNIPGVQAYAEKTVAGRS